MFKNKLVYKLTIGYVLLIFISMLIIGIFFIQVFREYTFSVRESNMLSRAKGIADVISSYIKKGAELNEYSGFIKLIESSVSSKLLITDNKGNVIILSENRLSVNEKKQPEGQLQKSIVNRALEGEEVKAKGFCGQEKEPTIAVGLPIYDESKRIIGSVSLYMPVTGITSTINKVSGFLLLAILVSIILTSLLSIFYSKLITKPLTKMNNLALEMANGNYSIRTNVLRSDELGQLSHSLDLLAFNLENTIDQLFQERNKLNHLIASISEGILAFDSNMKLLSYNEALKGILQYGLDRDITTALEKDLSEKQLIQHFEIVIKTGHTKTLLIDWNLKRLKFILSPVKNNQDEIIGVAALIQDISEVERLEQMRKDFIANVSHEFRTPLTLIRGSIEALKDGAVSSSEDIRKYYDKILAETEWLGRLINELLDLSRLQAGKAGLQIEEIDIVQLISDLIRSYTRLAENKNITINFIQNDVPPVLGDYYRLRQLFIIFIDNSIKYSGNDSKIEISLETGEYVFIKFRDEGAGIPKEDLPYIWERFYKADKSRGKSQSGTGLGLAIAKQLIDLHNGFVQVESEVGRGTIITIGFPY